MKKIILQAAAFSLAAFPCAQAVTEADFEDLAYTSGSFENGQHLAGSFTSRGATFANDYSAQFSSWRGFAYSKTTDTTTAGFGNQYSAWTGGGSGPAGATAPGESYGVAFADVYSPNPADLPTITLAPGDDTPLSLRLTNTTYAALTMRDGGSFGAVKFGGATGDTPDYLKLTISGLRADGSVQASIDFFLADFRFANNALDYIVNDWRLLDLTPLGSGVAKLRFGMESSQPDGFGGYATPTYFAVDNVRAVPEPGTLSLCALGLAGLAARRRSIARG